MSVPYRESLFRGGEGRVCWLRGGEGRGLLTFTFNKEIYENVHKI